MSRKTINKMAIEALGKSGKIRCSGRIVKAIDLSFRKCVGDQCNSQCCYGVAPANCESFLHLIFDRIGGDGRGSVCATRHCFDAFFRSELTETPGVTAIRVLRMRKDQLQVGHTIHPSDSGRQASERLPCCHRESAAGVPVTEFGCAGAGGAATVATLPLRNLLVVAIDRGATDPAGSLERCRKNLMMRVPLPWRCFSKSTIERYRSCQACRRCALGILAAENFAVHADDQYLLVVGPIEDADPPALR